MNDDERFISHEGELRFKENGEFKTYQQLLEENPIEEDNNVEYNIGDIVSLKTGYVGQLVDGPILFNGVHAGDFDFKVISGRSDLIGEILLINKKDIEKKNDNMTFHI